MNIKRKIKQLIIKGFRTGSQDPAENKRNSESPNMDFAESIKSHTPIFVYQMGKVASSSIYSSIKGQYAGFVFHGHNFREGMADVQLQQLYEHYQAKKFPIKIISLVREPISRNLSAFFENFKRDVGVAYQDSDYTAQELQAIFLKNYNHDIPLIWFDTNFKTAFNIDVFEYDFPPENYIIVEKDNVSLLLMKHDIPDQTKEGIVQDFIGLPNFKLTNANVSEKKDYAAGYSEVKKLKLPKDYVDRMLSSKYAQHFYKNDIQKIKEKFSKV